MKMGEYIRKLRTERNWTQEELGRMVGVNKAAVNKWESGAVENIKRNTILKLSEVFGVSPVELMCFEPLKSAPPDDLTLMIGRLDPTDLAKTVGFVEGLLSADKYKKDGASKTA